MEPERVRFTRMTVRPLKAGNLIKMFDGSVHFVQYVNSSGAYAVPLASINKEIAGQTVQFTAGGKTISVMSMVEHITPLSLGGNSQEYRRYVKMALALERKGGTVALKGVGFGEFDSAELEVDPVLAVAEEDSAAEGHTVRAESVFAPKSRKDKSVAKKAAKANGNGAVKREKVAKTVRNCVCGCGGQTTGNFVPGHDARFHGWLKKLADGRIDVKGKDVKTKEAIIPGSVIKALELVPTKEGARAKNPHFYQSE